MHRPLLLNGFMASGKSTVGELVARLAGRPFLDLDAEVEARAGRSVPEIFSTSGESAFRRLERAALEEALSSPEAPVVAVGGGALAQRAVRLDALDRAVVVSLHAPPEVLATRAEQQGGRPLLEGGDPRSRIAELLEQRALAYAEAHARLDATGPASAVAQRALDVWKRDPIAVAAGERSYAVDIGQDLVAARLPELAQAASLFLMVSDTTVAPLYADSVRRALAGARLAEVLLTPGEEHKRLDSLQTIWQRALDSEADRKSTIVALGGGVVSDVAGFAAACWMRGIPWIGIPTTLLAMVDASVGGKTAVDLGPAKNAVGAFWQPRGVLCDVAHLASEPKRGFVSALAEVVKTALIGDPALLALLEDEREGILQRDPELVADAVRRSVRVKSRVVSLDEREGGLRATLNLGHTIGHALEAQAGFTRLSHGEAVSLGLVAALRIGQRLGATPTELTERVERLLAELGLPNDLSSEPLDAAAKLIGHDKKRAGSQLALVVAHDVGKVRTLSIDLSELRALTRSLA